MMAGYIAPEYEEIEKSLQLFSQEHGLDVISVSSLIRGSIEVLEPEIPAASVAVINANKPYTGVSVKIKNIKVNLKFALNSIFSFKTMCDAEGVWLALTILKAIVFLLGEMEIKLDVKESIVLFCIYRLRSATSSEIMQYAEKNCKEVVDIKLKEETLEETLDNLEKLGTIKMDEGEYSLCETILIRKDIR